MSTLTRVMVGVVVILSLGSCGKDKEKAKRMAVLCEAAVTQLDRDSDKVEADTFRMMLQNVLSGCSSACDLGDMPSCATLKDKLGTMCVAVPDMCTSLCAKATEGKSLKRTACELAHK